jgi:hypothetical protein
MRTSSTTTAAGSASSRRLLLKPVGKSGIPHMFVEAHSLQLDNSVKEALGNDRIQFLIGEWKGQKLASACRVCLSRKNQLRVALFCAVNPVCQGAMYAAEALSVLLRLVRDLVLIDAGLRLLSNCFGIIGFG